MNRADDEDDATAKAVAAIEEKLMGFSKPLEATGGSGNGWDPRGFGASGSSGSEGASGTSVAPPSYYKMDAVQWMQKELGDASGAEPLLRANPPRRTPLMERAGTPVMSNSTSSRSPRRSAGKRSGSYGLTDAMDNENENDNETGASINEPAPMQTPLQRKFRSLSSSATPSSSRPGAGTKRTGRGGSSAAATSAALKQSAFRRHHDALREYLVAKRSLHARMELERRERELDQEASSGAVVPMDTSETTAPSPSLAQQESRAEVDYCKTLCQIAYGLSSIEGSSGEHPEGPTEEGHFWQLLATLRRLSLSALIWNDDSTSHTQNSSTQSFFLQQLASNVRMTPRELVDAMSPSTADSPRPPLAMQRKHQLLKWIQSCLELESKDTKSKGMGTRTTPSPGHPDDPAVPSLVSETDAGVLKSMMQVCLALVLEGRTSEAREVARSRGQSWRAAAWTGGEPCGYEPVLRDETKSVERVPVGNPNRFLWKRQVWKTGRKVLLHHSSQKEQQQNNHSVGIEEAAIYSILADDVQNALENPCIRSSWTRSLCVLLTGIHGRIEDEVLHRHNLRRRRSGGCFPGHDCEQHENEQLMHTAQLAAMTEGQVASLLENNPFLRQQEEQQQRKLQPRTHRVSYKSAMMAFVVGKSAILDLCQRETTRVVSQLREVSERCAAQDGSGDDDYVNQDWEGVRFLTHVALFLDSLEDSFTPVVCDGISEQKNAILFEYVQYLESRPDLWHMIALYVSFLPEPKAVEYFPTVLARVLDDAERKTMIGQIQELMPPMELTLLRRVVRLSLSAPSSASGTDDMDAIKCNSLQWLLQKDEHSPDALVCANILLRDFFLDEEEDKTHAAGAFVRDYLPGDLLDRVRDTVENESSESISDDGMDRINNANAEYRAFQKYLSAYEDFEHWKEVLRETPTALEDHHRIPNYANLSEMEKNIADSNYLRTWVREKKKHLEQTLGAAERARSSWHGVLTHEGGWLFVDGDDGVLGGGAVDAEEQKRRADLGTIRSRHLVLAANLYHQVCEETASWLSRSLGEAEALRLSREEALQRLGGGSASGGSAAHTPGHWYKHALDLATLVASDSYEIHKAFPRADLREFVAKIGETAVSGLMNP
ncbi:unnamed protein product [Pseudo-nitzschia multistriata]|uniref:Nuclear pore complex protein n=1 Tax=Pseudo-nitzschia multistriata TaxID=183589 RepID=A0A448Z2B9_9STRA|nr:unnamed protein product [Pseudo-nitzschia multistriata]